MAKKLRRDIIHIFPKLLEIYSKIHGYFACVDQSEEISISVASTWYQITNATNDLFTDVQTNAGIINTSDTFVVNATAVTGSYIHMKIDFKISGHGAVNVDWDVEVYNQTQAYSVPTKVQLTTTGANNRETGSAVAYDKTAAFGDVYILRIQNTTNTTNFTVTNAAIWLEASHLVKS